MTPKMQRIGIFVIAVVMIVGTLGSFAMFILADKNQRTEQDRVSQEQQDMLVQQQEEAQKLSDQHYSTFKEFEGRAVAFDGEAVGEEVTSIDLKEGDGDTIDESSVYRVYYMGWNPQGKVFDSSYAADGASLSSPLTRVSSGLWEFPGGGSGSVIEGWEKGVIGMRIGGVREITIPSQFAYGEQDRGEDIPPNTPLKFIVMTIPADTE